MREILFRGKTKYGKWVEGDFAKPCNIVFTTIGYDELLKQDNVELYNDEKVIPETIGQFTGLTDKNGKKIFEGDIVKGTITSAWNKELIKCEVVYKKDGFVSVERLISQNWIHKVKFAKDIEVIGNIYDNPELLEESNENQTK